MKRLSPKFNDRFQVFYYYFSFSFPILSFRGLIKEEEGLDVGTLFLFPYPLFLLLDLWSPLLVALRVVNPPPYLSSG